MNGHKPLPPFPLHDSNLFLICNCSSNVGSGGGGPGYPLGNKVFFAVLTVFKINVGDKVVYSTCGRSLSRKGINEAESIHIVVKIIDDVKRLENVRMVDKRRRGV